MSGQKKEEEKKDQPEGDKPEGGNPPEDKKPEEEKEEGGLVARFKKEREQRQKVEEELQKFRDKEAEQARKESEKKGEYDKIINSLEPKAKKWDEYEKTAKTRVEAGLEELPDNRKALVSSLIEKGDVVMAENLLNEFKSEKPKDAGGGVPSKEGETLTEEQLREKVKNATPAEYRKMKQEGLLDSLFPNK